MLRDGDPVPLTPKVFAILSVLIENHGHLVDKDTLIDQVWQDTFVGETSLTKNVSVLRKTLGYYESGKPYIETIPKSGYRFSAPVTKAITESFAPQPLRSVRWHGRVVFIALSLVLFLGAVGWLYSDRQRTQAKIRSIAVMPFVYENGGPEMDYLTDGMTDALIHDLSRVPGLVVKARQAVFRYKGKVMDAASIGKDLGADAVLFTRLGQNGDDRTATVELVDSATQTVVWAGNYSKTSSDLLGLQQEISANLTLILRSKISREGLSRSQGSYSENREAYAAYLAGKYFQNQRTKESVTRAHENFLKAVEIDPNYAAAWVGLADTYNSLGAIYKTIDPRIAVQQSRLAMRKALEFGPDLAEAHAQFGWHVLHADWDFAGARKEMELAVQLDPNSAQAHFRYAFLLLILGNLDEAIKESRTAEQLDPLDSVNLTYLGAHLVSAGHYEEAMVALRKSTEIAPNIPSTLHWMALLAIAERRYDDALANIEKALSIRDQPDLRVVKACIRARMGDKREPERTAKELVARRESRNDVGEMDFVQLYAEAGDKDKAFEWLQRAYENRSYDFKFLRYYPLLESLRDDPRFSEFVNRIG